MKEDIDPVLSSVHERMRITLMSKKERAGGGIMFKPSTLARVIDKFEGQYSSGSSEDMAETKSRKVRTIIK